MNFVRSIMEAATNGNIFVLLVIFVVLVGIGRMIGYLIGYPSPNEKED